MSTSSLRLAEANPLKSSGGLPLVLEVAERIDANRWARERQNEVRAVLADRGALLIRGLNFHSSAQFGQVLSTLFGSPLLEYMYRSTPRTALRGNVYTATEYPASQAIPQHNENAYARRWPLRIGFLCMLPATTGGETPIGDSELVYEMLPAAVRARFEELGVMYVRNYSTLDLPWSVVFQTDDRSEVEVYCREHELSFEWLDDGGLRTSQVNPATAIHPTTGRKLWFNQAHLFHVSSLQSDLAETLLASLGERNLPRNTYYGDGSPIEPETLLTIRSIYERTKIKFPWQKNDLLLLDNMRYTHGREPYSGPRKVLTGMACPNVPTG
jgi:alpha-ketoglutarate-dependent taurine dioxygenase